MDTFYFVNIPAEFFKPPEQSLDISGDLHLLLGKQEQVYLMTNEGNVLRAEMVIYPLYLINNRVKIILTSTNVRNIPTVLPTSVTAMSRQYSKT